MATFPIPFEIGAQVWTVDVDVLQVRETCPDCLGRRAVRLLLATGEKIPVDCGRCSFGFDGPGGVIFEPKFIARAVEFTCSRITYMDGAGSVHYTDALPDATVYRTRDAKTLFATKAEALKHADELEAQRYADHERMMLANLGPKRKQAADMARYWRTKKAALLKDVDRIDQRLAAIAAAAVSSAGPGAVPAATTSDVSAGPGISPQGGNSSGVGSISNGAGS